MHMMFSFHIAFVFNKKKTNIGENLQDIFLAYQILHVFSHDISIIWVLIYFAYIYLRVSDYNLPSVFLYMQK